jgi:CheY-like chemotaxis protein
MEPPNEEVYTVLIVDDNPDLLKLFAFGLPDMGNFRVVTAEDGIDGLTKFYEIQPDCIVIDVVMPGLNGYQLVRALRGDPDTANTPLIILTAMVQNRDRTTGMASGVDIYLTKPVIPSELVAAIHKAIRVGKEERRRRMEQLAREAAQEMDSQPF